MAELPQTRDLPTSAEGYERARVEEAFAEFAERVHELETVASDLRAELQTLRAERTAAQRPALPPRVEAESWPGTGFAPSPDWIGSVPAPIPHGLRVPRVVLEGVFLLLVGLFAGLADLSAERIVLVMAVAWVLVALAEWAAAATRARWHLDEVAPPREAGTAESESTGPWDVPVVEATVVDESESESKTVVTKLPTDLEAEEEPAAEAAQATAERRRFWRRRRSPTEAGAADPGEA
jgi:hypothetical protein